MNEVFDFSKNSTYELRCGNCLSRSNIHSTHSRIESIANNAAKIWNEIPTEIKETSSLTYFNCKVKKLVPQSCSYRLCKKYVGQVGFM